MQRHVAPLGHIIMILSQPVFALSPLYYLLSGEVTHTNLKVFDLIRLQLNIKIYHTQGKDTNHYLTDVVDHCGNCRNKYHFFFIKIL
jgi:hypothetical protein